MNKKDQKLIETATKENIPIFVLIAKDSKAVQTMFYYLGRCQEENCPSEHLNGIKERVREFLKWQTDHLELVKNPD